MTTLETQPVTIVWRDMSATQRTRRLPSPKVVVFATMAVRLAWLLTFHLHSHLVGEHGFNAFPYGGQDDGRYYYETAAKLADGTQPDYVLNAFPRVLALLMDLGIRNLLALKLISYVVSMISVVLAVTLVLQLTKHLDEMARRWAVIVVSLVGGLFPSSIFWSMNSIMRDGWILSFVLIFLWSTSSAAPHLRTWVRIPIGLVALAAAGAFRFYVVPVALAALVSSRIDLANPMRRVKARAIPVLRRLVIVCVGFILLCLVAAPSIEKYAGRNILGWRSRPEFASTGSALGYVFDGENPLVVVGLYLVSFVSNAVGPLPWQITSANQLLALSEIPFFIIIGAALFAADWRAPLARICGLFGLYWLLLLGLWNDVLGNAARNRINAWPVLAIVAAVALAQSWSDVSTSEAPVRWGLRQLLPPRSRRRVPVSE
ncbi:MAG: hypothetical protein AB7V43_03825 [Acidimicrobiia bacterium]